MMETRTSYPRTKKLTTPHSQVRPTANTIEFSLISPFHSMPTPMGTERVTREIMKPSSTWIRLDTMAFSEMMEDTTIPTMPFRMFSFSEVYQLVGLMALLIPSSDRLPRMASFIPPLDSHSSNLNSEVLSFLDLHQLNTCTIVSNAGSHWHSKH